jgi:hypothetical protein
MGIMEITKKSLALIMIGLLTLLFSFAEKNKTDAKHKQLVFTAQVGNWSKENNINVLSVNTTLTNNSPDTISYITMSCSWQEIYTTDTRKLGVDQSACGKNIPKLIKIPPHQKEEARLLLWTKGTPGQVQGLKFRIGVNLVIAKNYTEMFSKWEELGKMKNVIWSDTLKV